MRFALIALAAPLLAQQYDLVIRGGRVIDPKNGRDAVMDVAIAAGKIAAVAPSINAQAKQSIDAKGLIVTPGLIDIHTHLFHTTGQRDAWAGDNSIPPEVLGFRTGVTTMVDAGSSGWRNFETFRFTVIDRAKLRVLALINIAGLGMLSNPAEQNDFDPKAVAALAKKHKDVVVGVKTAHFEGPGWDSVDAAVDAGKLANIPVMVDFGFFLASRPYNKLVTERLRPGDISTHALRGPVPVIDANGRLYPYLKQARARGVLFDVGHGGGSFVWRNAVPAVEQGFLPDTISTDLHTGSMNAGMQDMPNTMDKYLAMGVSLPDVILRSTWNAAKAIKREELGHLTVGADADVAVWTILKGDFGFGDAHLGRLRGTERLACELTLRAGEIVWDWNARAATDWKTLPKNYGVRPVETIVVPQ